MVVYELNEKEIIRELRATNCTQNAKKFAKLVNSYKGISNDRICLIKIFVDYKINKNDICSFFKRDYNKITNKASMIDALKEYLWVNRPKHDYTYFKQNDWVYPILRTLESR